MENNKLTYEEVIKIQRDKALKGEYGIWDELDVRKVLDEYYSLTT